MQAEVVVVGAGIAGLTCARELVNAGLGVIVAEKSRGVGGRCASRRVDGSIVDHGLTFFHGSDDELRALLADAGRDTVVDGWPRRIRGSGAPCQPGTLREGDWRLAYANGMTVFPKYLAEGLELCLDSRVASFEPQADRWRIVDATGRETTARDLLLSIPTPQTLELLDSWHDPPRELEPLRWLLREVGFVSTLTVIASYPEGAPVPDWDMWYPEESAILQLVSHDSSKRTQEVQTVLVLQALPVWSNRQWQRPDAEWSTTMLKEAGRLAGPWAVRPETAQTHRWRYARIASGGDLSGPMMITLPGGCRLGFAGDAFSPGAGIQAAWRSGRELARRILEDQPR